ncbi:MAG TPA: response regulator [Thermoanaerobaculia bacterium]|jgi:DNA-binding response OmpR family regulator|nr:response regulator [Thermoanaerobaculia bacterium]
MSRVDPPGIRYNALVIDDDPGLQGLFTTLLAREGFAVDCAPNGRLAFEYLKRGSYSVILLDLMMPDVNGFELLDRLGRDSPRLLPRVIVMSGAAQKVVDSVDRTRIWGLIRKPFDINELVRSARQCADGTMAHAV